MAPLYGGMVVAILAVVAVALAKKNDKAREAAQTPQIKEEPEPVGNPFSRTAKPSQLKGDTEPSPEGLPPAPPDLLEAQVWIDAQATAERGLVALRAAREKRDAGNIQGYVKGALEARELFNQALDDTVQWDLDVVEAHGETDPLVQRMQKKRNEWFKHRKSLRKVEHTRF